MIWIKKNQESKSISVFVVYRTQWRISSRWSIRTSEIGSWWEHSKTILLSSRILSPWWRARSQMINKTHEIHTHIMFCWKSWQLNINALRLMSYSQGNKWYNPDLTAKNNICEWQSQVPVILSVKRLIYGQNEEIPAKTTKLIMSIITRHFLYITVLHVLHHKRYAWVNVQEECWTVKVIRNHSLYFDGKRFFVLRALTLLRSTDSITFKSLILLVVYTIL